MWCKKKISKNKNFSLTSLGKKPLYEIYFLRKENGTKVSHCMISIYAIKFLQKKLLPQNNRFTHTQNKTHCGIKEFEILKSLENSPERVHTFLRNLKSRDVNTYTDKEQW